MPSTAPSRFAVRRLRARPLSFLTAHLDQLTARTVIKLLQDAVAETGATVIAASHDPDLIAAADERLMLA